VNAAGGTSASTNCPTGSSNAYSTNFNLTENPISEGGKWLGGLTTGLNWNNAQTVPGKAYGAAIATGYNDPIAVLTTTFAANQYAQGTVHRAAGYAPGVSHEIELLLRFQITPNTARGYEVLWGLTGELNAVRWNGPLGKYDGFVSVDIGPAVHGDVLRAQIDGSVITVYKNGVLVHTFAADTMWTDGQPGMGFWPTPGATPSSYCWQNYSAGSL
jgi:hypothetical protein